MSNYSVTQPFKGFIMQYLAGNGSYLASTTAIYVYNSKTKELYDANSTCELYDFSFYYSRNYTTPSKSVVRVTPPQINLSCNIGKCQDEATNIFNGNATYTVAAGFSNPDSTNPYSVISYINNSTGNSAIRKLCNEGTTITILPPSKSEITGVLDDIATAYPLITDTPSYSVEHIVSISKPTTYYLVCASSSSNTVSSFNFEAVKIA